MCLSFICLIFFVKKTKALLHYNHFDFVYCSFFVEYLIMCVCDVCDEKIEIFVLKFMVNAIFRLI